MSLAEYQWRIEPNHLYSVRKLNSLQSEQQIVPNIMVNGRVNIYGLNGDHIPTVIDELCLPLVNHNVSGFAAFEIIPNFIYCKGEAVEIILSGIEVIKDLGELKEFDND